MRDICMHREAKTILGLQLNISLFIQFMAIVLASSITQNISLKIRIDINFQNFNMAAFCLPNSFYQTVFFKNPHTENQNNN